MPSGECLSMASGRDKAALGTGEMDWACERLGEHLGA